MARKHFLIASVLYSSSLHDMTDLEPKYHASFIPKSVPKHDSIFEAY